MDNLFKYLVIFLGLIGLLVLVVTHIDYDNVVKWRWGFLNWRLWYKIVGLAFLCLVTVSIILWGKP